MIIGRRNERWKLVAIGVAIAIGSLPGTAIYAPLALLPT